MSDELQTQLVAIAIFVVPLLFVLALSVESRARTAHGDRQILKLGYRTPAGWAMAIGFVIIAYWLLSQAGR